jgi:SAM-dependent methyltransferase
MPLKISEILQLRAQDRANQKLGDLIEGAEAVALLSGAINAGILGALSEEKTAQQIARATGINEEQVIDVLCALKAYGLVKQRNGAFKLAPHMQLLTSTDAPNPLADTLRVTNIRMRNIANIAETSQDYTSIQADEVLSIAQGIISALSLARNFAGIAIGDMMPELKKLWLAGARHLESGCGVGNTLFQILTTYPRVTGVGIEIEESTANEARRRADLLGMTGRVEIRQTDACTLKDEAVFDTAQWSQFFFPESCRADALSALFRALKPGGYVFMPLLLAVSDNVWAYRRDMLRMSLRLLISRPLISLLFLRAILLTGPANQMAEKRLASLQELVYGLWGIPARTTEELQLELEGSGFRTIRVVPIPATRLFPNRGFLLAQKT